MAEPTSEKETGIRWIGVLILAFILVYTLFFGMKKTDVANSPEKASTSFQQVGSQPTETAEQLPLLQVQEAQEDSDPEESTPQEPTPSSPELEEQGIFSVQSLFETDQPQEEGMMLLDGTHHREGTMQSAELLGLTSSIKYILKNIDNTHFVYLGDTPPDITDRVAQQWWNLVALSTKNDIDAHWLFGDTIIQISLPEYQKVKHKQLFLVQFKETGDRWFLQVDDDAYERSKPLFKERFGKRYDL